MSTQPLGYVFVFTRIVIGLTFALSLIGKLRDFQAIEQAISRFQLLPPSLHRPAAILSMLGEFAVLFLVLLGRQFAVYGLLLAIGLLVVFTTALASVLLRKIRTSCNCFGPSEKPVSHYDLWRNTGFIICALAGCGTALAQTDARYTALSIAEVGLAGLAAACFVTIWLNLADIVQLVRQL